MSREKAQVNAEYSLRLDWDEVSRLISRRRPFKKPLDPGAHRRYALLGKKFEAEGAMSKTLKAIEKEIRALPRISSGN